MSEFRFCGLRNFQSNTDSGNTSVRLCIVGVTEASNKAIRRCIKIVILTTTENSSNGVAYTWKWNRSGCLCFNEGIYITKQNKTVFVCYDEHNCSNYRKCQSRLKHFTNLGPAFKVPVKRTSGHFNSTKNALY